LGLVQLERRGMPRVAVTGLGMTSDVMPGVFVDFDATRNTCAVGPFLANDGDSAAEPDRGSLTRRLPPSPEMLFLVS